MSGSSGTLNPAAVDPPGASAQSRRERYVTALRSALDAAALAE